MNREDIKRLFSDVAPIVRYDEPLRHHTTWRIGGPADVFVVPNHLDQIRDAVTRAKAEGIPVFVIGRGSNLLVKDGGIRGLVIKLGDDFSALDITGETLTALAGRGMVSAANIAIRHGLSGLEFATGIPGTVGGAVTMNAGAHGSEIKDVLYRASVLDQAGDVQDVDAAQLSFGYRRSAIVENGWTVLSATFHLHEGDPAQMQERVKAWSKRRQTTQPLSMPNCGSVFRNPPGDHAARLIEAAGLKNFQIGQAAISQRHANFIVNLGQASAIDALSVIMHAKVTVREQFGVDLVPEVKVVGEDEAGG